MEIESFSSIGLIESITRKGITMKEMGISRRGFLGMGAASLAAAGMASLAGCAPQAKSADDSSKKGDASAEASADWLGEAPEIAESDIKETIDTEVLCIGAGIAGLITAAQVGEGVGKAIVVEKLGNPSTFRTDIGGIDTKIQLAQDVHVDKAGVINEIQRYCSGQANGRLLKIWADESGEAVDWVIDLLEEAGIEVYLETDPGASDMIYKEWTVTHGFNDASGAMDALVARVEGTGGVIKYNCPMVKLEREEGGRVTGAICQDGKEGYVRINASRGVVVATGGFANNMDMLKALVPDMFEQCVMKEMTPSQDGDGIKASLWIGADMDPDGFAQAFERGCVPFEGEYEGPSEDGQIWWPGSQPFLRVTRRGERFSNESTPYDFAMWAIREQHDNTWVEIFDANWQDQIAQFKTVGCSRIIDPGTMPGWEPTMPMEAICGMLEAYVEQGYIKKADTIEELAEAIGCDSKTLSATIERYNELCDKGVDEDFYKESSRMAALTTPPYYAARIGGMLLSSGSGLTVNTELQVLDKQGEAIEGLYAVGNDCGGTYARTYPSRVAGLTMGRNVTFARRIAKELTEK